ncbi:MAG TPA: ferredoxin family protein [Polyangiaceae bacterium]
MAYVVTHLCLGCKDTACMTVCPVDCFYEVKEPTDDKPDILYINPDECIDCDACVPECPWEAIFAEADVPEVFQNDTALNKLCMDQPDLFKKAVNVDKPQPSPDEIETNKHKWGL